MSSARFSPRSSAQRGLWLLIPFVLLACGEEEPYPDTPGALLWDHEWASVSTHAELSASSPFPFPTDTALLDTLRYEQGGAPSTDDVLEGVRVVFELDGRLLAKPVGFERPESSGTKYRVEEDGFLRFSVEKSAWFRHFYSFDASRGTLLLTPADAGGGVLMGFVLDIVDMSLFAGDLDSAAARVGTALLSDPRVQTESDRFLYDLVHGDLGDVPIEGAEDIVSWLGQLLTQTGIVPADVERDGLEAELEPIAEELLSADSEGIAEGLLDQILASDVAFAIAPGRVEKVLPFSLYRSTLESRGYLSNVERVELVLAAD